MKTVLRRSLVVVMAIGAGMLGGTPAFATQNSAAVWNGITLQGALRGNWGYWFEQQVRLNDGWDSDPSSANSSPDSLKTRGNRWILRPALVWNAPSIPGLQLFAGGALVPNLSPVRGEQRIWEQAQYSQLIKSTQLAQRLRLEQRHVDRTLGVAHRVRYQLRIARPGSTTEPWGWAFWDELFFNLNTVEGGPKSGLDQNRAFVGPQYQVDSRTRLEWGYLQSWIAQGSARDVQLNHVVALFVALNP